MSEFIFFVSGFLIGTLAGVTAMCVMQINRLTETTNKKERENTNA